MIEIKNLEVKYGDFQALYPTNLHIKEGEFFTLLGPSGCGKTTTLRTLVGFIQPASGSIKVEGKEITEVPVEKREIGMVFQSYALFPTMTVFENIAFGLKVKKLSNKEIEKRVHDVAEKIHINEKQLFRNVSELSGGQQQRVALARAMVLEPKILCLDEPLSNLDAKLRIKLRTELKRLQKELGITTIYVTHDQEEALSLSDRIAVFNNGTIEQVGTPNEVYSHSSSEFVCDFIGDINRIKAELLAHINHEAGTNFDLTKDAFIRLERVHTEKHDDCVAFEAKIIENEYNGVILKYKAETIGQTIKCLDKNDGKKMIRIGKEVTFYINPEDIMQF